MKGDKKTGPVKFFQLTRHFKKNFKNEGCITLIIEEKLFDFLYSVVK